MIGEPTAERTRPAATAGSRSRARSVTTEVVTVTTTASHRSARPASERAVLRRRDFGSCTPEELARLRRLMSRMKVVTPRRPSRRRRRHPRGDAIDLRASIRRAHRTGGDPATLVRRRVTERRRRVVLIADVSGSMEAYSRAYLYLLHGAVRALRAETFVFSTRLTRVTRTLAVHDPERALATAMAATDDWSGGTRIGGALKEFNDRWGRRGLARGAVVVIVSDGWESGDTDGARARRWIGSRASRIGSCGSTRGRRARSTNRSSEGWRPRSRMSTRS